MFLKALVVAAACGLCAADGGVVLANTGSAGGRSVEKVFKAYKCQKPVDQLQFGKEAKDAKCHFRELEVTDASLSLIVDNGDLAVNATVEGTLTEGFDGGFELQLDHDESGKKFRYTGEGSRKENGIPFCKKFSHTGTCAEGSFKGSVQRNIPTPLKGYWTARLTFRANSGDTIGRVTYEFKVATKTLRKVTSSESGTKHDAAEQADGQQGQAPEAEL